MGDIEDIVYGKDVDGSTFKSARVKDLYELIENGTPATSVFEALRSNTCSLEVLGLPGTNGTVTFSKRCGGNHCLDDGFVRQGVQHLLNREGLSSLLAFAKNGSPMVPSAQSEGYVEGHTLNPMLAEDPSFYEVDNSGGPLCVIIPSADAENCGALSVKHVKSITVKLEPTPLCTYIRALFRFGG